jgi:glutamyl-tRNA synthetase
VQRQHWADYLRPNSTFPAEAQHWAQRLYHGELAPSAEALAALAAASPSFWQAALAAQQQHPTDYASFLAALKALTNAKGKALFAPLRAALTGELAGPELAGLYALLPPAQLRSRLQAAHDAQSLQ